MKTGNNELFINRQGNYKSRNYMFDKDVHAYKEQYAEQMMQEHCKEHHISCPNHIIKDALRIAFMHGFEYACQKFNIE